jgi:nucleoside-diphosphate-sugar epimerase
MALSDQKLLVAGATGQVALPLAASLAKDNEVWGISRFSDQAARQKLEDAGVRCVTVDLVNPDLSGLPRDFTYVANLAIMKSGDWTADLDASAGAVALLMEHCQDARAFLHCSSTAVYKPVPGATYAEGDELGDNHGVWAGLIPGMNTYSIGKIAAEAVARYGSRRCTST